MYELILQEGASKTSQPSIFIMGPTATGKTGLAIECVKSFDAEIISVDSAMVYREMDIGSAKPSQEELTVAPHRLIDVCDPSESYSAGRFREDALREMSDIYDGDSIPVLVGGTMLYFNILQEGIAELPEADIEIRNKLDRDVERLSWDGMYDRLKQIDPISADRIHPNDPQRIHRALEVFEITGKTLTECWQEQQQEAFQYPVIKIALMPPDREELRKQITRRFDQMLQNGFIDEVKHLMNRGDLNSDMSSIRAVGYRQIWSYLSGEYDYETMREKAIIATAQLAKRQMTWLRKQKNCNFIDPATLNTPKLLKSLKDLL